MAGDNITQLKNFTVKIENLNLTINFDELTRPTSDNDLELFARLINSVLTNAVKNSRSIGATEINIKGQPVPDT